MKKLLLFFVLLTAPTLFAQAVNSQDFNSLTIGNVGSSFTGASAGAGGLYTYASNGTAPTTATNAGNTNFQIVTGSGTHGNVLQLIGTNGDKGSRFVWMSGLASAWSGRTAGNNIIEFEYEFYTGSGGGSNNSSGVSIYDVTGTKVLGGFSFDTNTLALSGVAYYSSATAPVNSYSFYLGAAGTNLILTANTWVRVGVSFNKTTGKVTWKGPGVNGFITGAAVGTDPDEIDFISFSGTTTVAPIVTNTSAATILIDNFVTKISATDTLLQNDTFDLATINFSVSPNPANDFVTISNADNISVNAISITDINGRVVKQNTYSNVTNVQVNVSDLASGVYMMNITSDKGAFTKKIIKN